MGFIAIVGSGALGGAVAHALAVRDRVPEVRLIDPAGQVARGKALDIQQSSPIDSFSTTLTAAESIDAAVGADVVVIADAAAGNVEHAGEAGLGLLRQLVRAGSRAPILCAGASQRELIGKAVTELHLPRGLDPRLGAVRARVRAARARRPHARWIGVSKSASESWACRRVRRSSRGKKRPRTDSRWRRRWRRTRSPASRRGFRVCGRRVRTRSPQPPRASSRRSRTDRDAAFRASSRLMPARCGPRSARCRSSSDREA